MAFVGVGRALEGIDERPGLAFVRPVVGLEPVRLAEPRHRVGRVTAAVQLLAQLEGGRGRRHVERARLRPPDDLVGRQRVPAGGAVRHPVAHRDDVRLVVELDLARLEQGVGEVGWQRARVDRQERVERLVAPG